MGGNATVSRRAFLRCAVASLGGLVLDATLTACSATSSSMVSEHATPTGATTAPAAIGTAQTRIVVWYWNEVFQALVKQFEHDHADIKVELRQSQDYTSHHENLLNALKRGSETPDIAIIERGYIGAFTETHLLDLSEAPFSGTRLKEHMLASMWSYGISKGHMIAIPLSIDPGAFWYRTDLLAATGVPTEPESLQSSLRRWDDFIAIGELLKQKNPTTAFIPNALFDIFRPMIEQQGHGWIDDTKVLISKKGTRAAQLAAAARKKRIDGRITTNSAWDKAVLYGTVAGVMLNSGALSHVTSMHPQTAGKWRVMHAPEGDFSLGGVFLAIPAPSKQPEAAWTFVEYITTNVALLNTVLGSSGLFPAYTPAWNDRLYDQPVAFFGDQRVFRLWADIAAKAPAGVASRYDQQVDTIVMTELDKALTNGTDPIQAVEAAQAAIIKQIPGLLAV